MQLVHPSISIVFPSSHYSLTSRIAFPQTFSVVQNLEHPSPSIKLPSSHYSVIIIPSPQIGLHGVNE